MSEITAEKVQALLEGIKNVDEFISSSDLDEIRHHAIEISQAYIAKCEEVEKEVHEKFLIDGNNQRLSLENQRLNSIINKQRSALSMALGYIEEVSRAAKLKPATLIKVEQALALTQQ